MKTNYKNIIIMLLLLIGLPIVAQTQKAPVVQGPTIDPLLLYPWKGVNTLFLYFDSAQRPVKHLRITRYSDADALDSIAGLQVIRDGVSLFPTLDKCILIQLNDYSVNNVIRFTVDYVDGGLIKSDYFESELTPYQYMSDLPFENDGTQTLNIDKDLGGGPIIINGKKYAKGFGTHAVTTIRTPDVTRFNRMVTTVCKRQGQPYLMEFILKLDGVEVTKTGNISYTQPVSWDKSLTGIQQVEIVAANGTDGTGNDHANIGGARYYVSKNQKQTQTIQWLDRVILKQNKPIELPLQGVSDSGLPLQYHILTGSSYATITSDNKLAIHTIPDTAQIVVEAIQPGNLEYAAATPKQCCYQLTRAIVVKADQSVLLPGGTDIEELIVYGNATSCGEVRVEGGIVNVKSLIFKQTFKPGKWNFMAFPVSINLEKRSNFNQLGYQYNRDGVPSWYIKEYDGESRAIQGDTANNWKVLPVPFVEANKGYILGLDSKSGTDSVEVIFTFENVALDFESSVRSMNLSLDLTGMPAADDYKVYVKADDVKGNVLNIKVAYRPPFDKQPLNYAYEAEHARIISFDQGKQFRVVLPNSESAKVFILDKKGKKVIRAYDYQSPGAINVSDLKRGQYPLVLQYGGAISIKTFQVK